MSDTAYRYWILGHDHVNRQYCMKGTEMFLCDRWYSSFKEYPEGEMKSYMCPGLQVRPRAGAVSTADPGVESDFALQVCAQTPGRMWPDPTKSAIFLPVGVSPAIRYLLRTMADERG